MSTIEEFPTVLRTRHLSLLISFMFPLFPLCPFSAAGSWWSYWALFSTACRTGELVCKLLPLSSFPFLFTRCRQLVAVNQRLGAYRALHDAVDAWVVIQVNDVQCVFQWRLEVSSP